MNINRLYLGPSFDVEAAGPLCARDKPCLGEATPAWPGDLYAIASERRPVSSHCPGKDCGGLGEWQTESLLPNCWIPEGTKLTC